MDTAENILVSMTDITKNFPGVKALDHAFLQIYKGEVHVLCGENGAGKSTLMKLLSGAYEMESGEIFFDGSKVDKLTPKSAQMLGIGIIYQELNLVNSLTVAENIYLGREQIAYGDKFPKKINWQKMHEKTFELLSELNLEIDPNALVEKLGIGQQQMVEIAKALSIDAKLIIMDEPTAALTEREIEHLFKFIKNLKRKGISTLYISHRLEEFEQIADRITVMRDGKTVQTVNAKKTTIPELIRLMVGRELVNQFPRVEHKCGDVLMRVEGFTRRGMFRDISFHVNSGEILGVSGLIGSGRTELMQAIFGVERPNAGSVFINGRQVHINSPRDAIREGIGFVTEDRKKEGLVLCLSVEKNITLPNLSSLSTKSGVIRLNQERGISNQYVNKLNIKTPSVSQIVKNLSGGNQQKVVL
ncbi:MAG: sugar ABC transporter ATP-binding protein, partial [Synergistaceae bacterium]|nr:sugar ABC transporter ATP-binding protein [Synergistaceae bacterium]